MDSFINMHMNVKRTNGIKGFDYDGGGGDMED